MAVPTIVSVNPASGLPGGGSVVEITGTNFRIPTSSEDSVAVSFGGTFSSRVDVASATRLFVTVPNYMGSALFSASSVAVDVLVKNVDANGNDIAGESVTSIGAFTYAKPEFSTEHESELKAVTRALLSELSKQVAATVPGTHPDYESNSIKTYVVELPKLPGLVLVGPDMEENRFYSTNEEIDVDDESTDDINGHVEFDTLRVPYTVDLTFTLYGFSDSNMEILNFKQGCVHFFKRNVELSVTTGIETAVYELELVEDFKRVGTPGDANLHCFSGVVLVRGVNLYGSSGAGDPLLTERKSRGIYTDEQGAEITVEQTDEAPSLVVRAILS